MGVDLLILPILMKLKKKMVSKGSASIPNHDSFCFIFHAMILKFTATAL